MLRRGEGWLPLNGKFLSAPNKEQFKTIHLLWESTQDIFWVKWIPKVEFPGLFEAFVHVVKIVAYFQANKNFEQKNISL